MPIVHMCAEADLPVGAINVKRVPELEDGWTHETHHGLCVAEQEKNRYDHSDFFMVVYNPESDTFSSEFFATTRGWSYPCYASRVDATQDVLARYRKWQDDRNEAARQSREASMIAAERKLIADSGLCDNDAKKILALRDGAKIMRFLAKKVRSEFKLSLRGKIIEWLNDASPRFAYPLSKRQMEFI